MRGTTKITNNNALYYINRNHNALSKVSNQISLQQQVINLEDNPLAANIGIRLFNTISRSEQYNRTVKTGIAALNLTDAYLGESKTIMDTVKSLVVGAAQDTTTPEQRAANAIEINEILQQLVMSGNSQDGERYIFGGQQTTTPPFTIVNGRYVEYTGNDQDINALVDSQTVMAINATGSDAYGDMITSLPSRDLNPDVTLATDRSTRLADLNAGTGVPKGKITVYYSAYPDGLEVDLS
ncbi:MAG: flagellar hook-associated protein FlgL, partial [Planctomycetota bacterium]|nr:flagellar hook-associated protein FlgL [Planctomycetota bacterium]